MIALARSAAMKRWAQGARSMSDLATRYVAGESAESGVQRAATLLADPGVRSSLFYLGEYVDRLELVEENVAAKLKVAALLGSMGLDVHVPVDPTQIGHLIDPASARRNAWKIAEAIAAASGGRAGVHALMLDMEDQSVNEATLALHDELAAAGLPVALTLQAYLRRTEADLALQVRRGSKVRLVKGVFAAGRDVAFSSRTEIKTNFHRLIDVMFSRSARDAGFYPIVATHDVRLHAYALERAEVEGWKPGEYEFELLLGVRGDIAADLARRGERVRLYVSFGRDWWPHAVRRIGENPRNAFLLARSLAGTA
jgi:proline dehydrogenase